MSRGHGQHSSRQLGISLRASLLPWTHSVLVLVPPGQGGNAARDLPDLRASQRLLEQTSGQGERNEAPARGQ